MVQGNFNNGDYFIDCDRISQSTLRSIFGVWLNVDVSVIALCVRSVYRSRMKRQLLPVDDQREGKVDLWGISPAATPSEFFELRNLLARALRRGKIFYVLTSFACILAATASAGNTTISNHAIVTNIATRHASIPVRLATRDHSAISSAPVDVASRVRALDNANAPLSAVFDGIPPDTSNWVYNPEEWKNSWSGDCTYNKHQAVDLVVYPTNSTNYQEEVPLLGKWLPAWATADPMKQGTDYSGFYDNSNANSTGSWKDMLATYVFGSIPSAGVSNASTVNISIANFLAHNVARDPSTTYFQTAFKSDVYVVDCQFNNAIPGAVYQARVDGGGYANAASNVANLYKRSVIESSVAGQPVVQPTAEQMLRYWQAFLSVQDAQYPYPVQRTLSVSQPVVQIRLSILLITTCAFLFATVPALSGIFSEPRDRHGRRIHIPGSQLDWTVQAVYGHNQDDDVTTARSSIDFALQHEDLAFVTLLNADGRRVTFISSKGSDPASIELSLLRFRSSSVSNS